MLLLLWSLAAVNGHSACKRAEGLELMLELQDRNSHQWKDKDQHKGMTKIGRHRNLYLYVHSDARFANNTYNKQH